MVAFLLLHFNCDAVLEKKEVYMLVKMQSYMPHWSNNEQKLSSVHFNGAILFVTTKEDQEILVVNPNKPIRTPSVSSSFHAQSIYNFGKSVLAPWHTLNDCLTYIQAMNWAKTLFDILLETAFDHTEPERCKAFESEECRSKSCASLLTIQMTRSCSGSGRMRSASIHQLKSPFLFSPQGHVLPSKNGTKPFSILTFRSSRECCMPVEIISLNETHTTAFRRWW